MFERITGYAVLAWLQLTARLPRWLAKAMSRPGGWLLRHVLRHRASIVVANLRYCFPQWSDQQRNACTRQHFRELAYSFYEIALSWCIVDSRSLPPCTFVGLEHIDQARSKKRGILMVCGHFVTMEITGRYYGEQVPSDMVYRPLRNPTLEAYQRRARHRYADQRIVKQQPGKILRSLRADRAVWFAPDQDFGPERSVFVDFFGHPTATLVATWRLARSSGAEVLTLLPERLKDGSYRITIGSPVPGCDAESPAIMLTEINRRIEAGVRAHPAQYWWLHRRFKTRPDGVADLYPS